ncbi:AP-3 complex subunit delta [Raphanus sativus]|nr:AP-3 complex subunit delta [Raphanus sativus]
MGSSSLSPLQQDSVRVNEASRICYEHQLIDIGMRVRDARPQLVRVSWALLIDPASLGNLFLHPVLSAASWVSVFKVLLFCLGSYFSAKESSSGSTPTVAFTYESILKLANVIEIGVWPLSGAYDVEVQERAKNVLGFIGMVKKEIAEKVNNDAETGRVTASMEDVFSEELGPVSASAQERVCVPDGLELEENLGDLEEIFLNLWNRIRFHARTRSASNSESEISKKPRRRHPHLFHLKHLHLC